MSGTFPNTPAASTLKISSMQPTRVSFTQSLKRQARASGSQRYRLKLSFPPMTREQFAPIKSFLESQSGQFETFFYAPPIESNTRGSATSVITVSGSFSRGDKLISLSGADASLLVGDYISFSNHSKVYMVKTGGQSSIELTSPLMLDVPDATTLTYSGVTFLVAKTNDVTEYTVRVNQLYMFDLELVEVY